MNHPTTASFLKRAQRVTPGGVNTSIRRVDPMPIWSRAAGSRVYDIQGREYIDYRQMLLKSSIFKLPMSLKRSHIGAAHTEEDIDRTLSAAEDAFRRLVRGESRPVALQSVGTESGEPK